MSSVTCMRITAVGYYLGTSVVSYLGNYMKDMDLLGFLQYHLSVNQTTFLLFEIARG